MYVFDAHSDNNVIVCVCVCVYIYIYIYISFIKNADLNNQIGYCISQQFIFIPSIFIQLKTHIHIESIKKN